MRALERILKSTYKSIISRQDLCSELILMLGFGSLRALVLQSITEIQVLLTLKGFCKWCEVG